MKKGSIAIIGSRGIPASYGGFETMVEQIAPRLASSGWKVFVSCEGCEPADKRATYKGVNLFYFPIRPFFRVIYETLYDIYSLIRASFLCDYILILGYGAGLFFFIPRIFNKPLAVNVDGLEWERPKFNRIEKFILLISAWAAAKLATTLVADSMEIKRYMDSKYNRTVVYIPYGVDTPHTVAWDKRKLAEQSSYGPGSELQPGSYWLIVARLEPENNIHVIIQSFLASGSTRQLVIIGDSPSTRYKKRVDDQMRENHAMGKVILPGAIYDLNLLNMLRQNCFGYIHGHTVGGTNPALLEAMSMRNIIIAHDNEFNREVGGEYLLYFEDTNDLSTKIRQIENKPDTFAHLKEAAYSRVVSKYSWHDAVEQYDNLFSALQKE